jgi:hypothetical protein
MRPVRLLMLIASVAAPAIASAQESVVRQPDRHVYPAKTYVEFTGVPVEGKLERPSDTYLLARHQPRFGSLMSLRMSFSDELRKSSDNL